MYRLHRPITLTPIRVKCPACEVAWAATGGTSCWTCGQPGITYLHWYDTERSIELDPFADLLTVSDGLAAATADYCEELAA